MQADEYSAWCGNHNPPGMACKAAMPLTIQKLGGGCGARSKEPPSKTGCAFALALSTRVCPGEEACAGAGITQLAGREAGRAGSGAAPARL